MSTVDAGFYFAEHGHVPMHIGSLAVFEGPAPAYGDLVRLVQAKLPLVPRFRQVVRTAPLQAFRPAWADDAHFEIRRHVRHAAVPAPGGPEDLRALATWLLSLPLDRTRPLWEEWLLDGLPDGRWAILSKVHHCLVDGVGGTDLMAVIFDAGRDAGVPPAPRWTPAAPPSPARELAGGLADLVARPARQLAVLPGLARRLSGPGDLRAFGGGLASTALRLLRPSAAFLNGPVGPHRRWDWATVSMAEVKDIRGAHGGTVNDVLLAAVTRAFRDLIQARRELTRGLVVRTLVPVSVRAPDEHGFVTNRFSAVLVNLPVSEPDPLRRLLLVRAQMNALKRTSQAVGGEILAGVLGLVPPGWLALSARAAFRVPQSLVQTITTNTPGPRLPLYVLGRRMQAVYPYAPLGSTLRISVAILSYLDTISLGVTGDRDAVPDLGILTGGIGRGLAELRPPADN